VFVEGELQCVFWHRLDLQRYKDATLGNGAFAHEEKNRCGWFLVREEVVIWQEPGEVNQAITSSLYHKPLQPHRTCRSHESINSEINAMRLDPFSILPYP
jgi:hypothetical protein